MHNASTFSATTSSFPNSCASRYYAATSFLIPYVPTLSPATSSLHLLCTNNFSLSFISNLVNLLSPLNLPSSISGTSSSSSCEIGCPTYNSTFPNCFTTLAITIAPLSYTRFIRPTSFLFTRILCPSLERFLEILEKLENMRELRLHHTSIKELPFSFKNLVGLRELTIVSFGRILRLPSTIVTMPELTEFNAFELEGLQWLNHEVEEKVGSLVSSKIEVFSAPQNNLRDDFFSICFTQFVHVKELDLSKNNFTIIPECIKEFQFLWKLSVTDCKHLREIRGIPPSLKHFYAENCNSLAYSSANIFLNKELHEAGNTFILLPRERIPEWFDQHSRLPSISFWFRNKLPDKMLCLIVARKGYCYPEVFINGNERPSHGRLLGFGIHIFEQGSSMEDVRFTDPYSERKLDNNLNSLGSQNPSKWNKFCFTLYEWLEEVGPSIGPVYLYTQFGIIKELTSSRINELMFSNKWEVNSSLIADKNRLLQEIRRVEKDLETSSTSTTNSKERVGGFVWPDGWANVYCDGGVSYANPKAVCAGVITNHMNRYVRGWFCKGSSAYVAH